MSRRWFIALAACVGLLATTSLAQAISLPPGGAVVPDVSNGMGMVIATQTGTFTYMVDGSTTTGMYTEMVETGRPGNTLGGLSFVYSFTAQPSTFPVQVSDTSSWNGFATNVFYNNSNPDSAIPALATRTGNGNGIGFTLRNDVGGSFALSAAVVIDTDAPITTNGWISFSGSGGGTGNLPFIAPAAPEPATLTLALVGLPLAGAFGLRRLRRGKPA
jgi:hypothetical protein